MNDLNHIFNPIPLPQQILHEQTTLALLNDSHNITTKIQRSSPIHFQPNATSPMPSLTTATTVTSTANNSEQISSDDSSSDSDIDPKHKSKQYSTNNLKTQCDSQISPTT